MLKFGRNLTPELIAEEEDLLALIEVGGIGQTLKDLIDKEFVVVLLPPRDAIAALDKNNAATKDAVLFHVLDYEEFIKAMRPCKAADVEWSRATTKNGKDITIWCKPPAGGPAALPSDGLLMSEIALPGNLWKTDFGDLTVCRIPRVLLATPESANARFGSALRIDMAAWGVADMAGDEMEPIGLTYSAPNEKKNYLAELASNSEALLVYAIGALNNSLWSIARVSASVVSNDYDKTVMRFRQEVVVETAKLLTETKKLSARLPALVAILKEERSKFKGKAKFRDVVEKNMAGTSFTASGLKADLNKINFWGKWPGRLAEKKMDAFLSAVFADGTDKWSKALLYSTIGFAELQDGKLKNAEDWFDKAVNQVVVTEK